MEVYVTDISSPVLDPCGWGPMKECHKIMQDLLLGLGLITFETNSGDRGSTHNSDNFYQTTNYVAQNDTTTEKDLVQASRLSKVLMSRREKPTPLEREWVC